QDLATSGVAPQDHGAVNPTRPGRPRATSDPAAAPPDHRRDGCGRQQPDPGPQERDRQYHEQDRDRPVRATASDRWARVHRVRCPERSPARPPPRMRALARPVEGRPAAPKLTGATRTSDEIPSFLAAARTRWATCRSSVRYTTASTRASTA